MLNATRPNYYDEELIARSFCFFKTSLARVEGGARCMALIIRLEKSAYLEKSTRLLYRLCRYQRVPRTVGESSIINLLRDDL